MQIYFNHIQHTTDFIESFNTKILDTKYDKVIATECASQQKHMTED